MMKGNATMPLDYKRSYKTKVKRRRILTISIIIVVFLLASFSIFYFKYWADDTSWNPITLIQNQIEQQEQASASDTGVEAGQAGEPFGLALKRQPIHIYTIGIARVGLVNVRREYVHVEKTVEDAYFEDALFIGDSRTEGFMLYSNLSNIHAYCSKGLSISRIYTDTIVNMEDGRTLTVMEALQEQEFKKIYIMFGVNELGWPYDDVFREQYSKLLRDVRQLQPDAVIYVENIIPISASRSATDPIYNNDNVNRFNDMIKAVCEEQDVIYLDVASALADENGALPENASSDGIHCNIEYCNIWMNYLRNNTYELQ
ncbi:MAG: GDSL-type esterase/lipase family protein [Bacteroides sp.]|nr:GDSL-type esterase/lipase family protein [Bacteroides sp.]MCM1550817.1 GDSL-type esterase/lipase family protein [Clostridium sp.]